MGKLSVAFLAGILSATAVWTAPVAPAAPAASDLSDLDFKVGGYVDGGRFQLADSSVNGEIINRMGAKWDIAKSFNDNWSAMASLHWMFWRNQATDIAAFHIAGLKFDSDVQGAFAYESGMHRVKIGLYEFKYNPDSKNLGEYLLRTEAYPTIIESSQGKDLLAASNSRVAGVEYGTVHETFRHKALLYAEQHNVPVNDLSMAYLAAVGPERAELGLGVAYHRFAKLGDQMNDGTLDPALKAYIKRQGLDTRAVKLIARGRLDLGAMLDMQGSFKVYGEAALLGLKSDSLYYKNVMQRVPLMAGLDIPTAGILNTLSIEVQYFKNPYLDKKYLLIDGSGSKFSPLPLIDDYQDLPNYSKDDWKWSVMMHKALNNWIDVKLRLASDHLRLRNWNGDYEGGAPLTRDAKDWYLLARIEYHN